MGFDRTRQFLLALPHVEETLQWNAVVFWVADKAVGGKMFAVLPAEPEPEGKGSQVLSFAVPHEAFDDLLELEGVCPAPYLARAHWVSLESWAAMPERALHTHLLRAHDRIAAALPRKTQRLLEGTTREYRAAVRTARAGQKSRRAGKA